MSDGLVKPVQLPFMKTFCLYFSVRLGIIIIGVFTMIQSVFIMVLLFIAMQHIDWVLREIKSIKEYSDLIILFETIENEPKMYGIGLFSLYFFLFISCIMLILGGLKVQETLSYLFIITYFIHVGFLFTAHILTMTYLKERGLDLGSLSILSIIGGFIILFLYYQWFCVLSFGQIVKQLRYQMTQLSLVYGQMPLNSNLRIQYY